MAAIRQFVVENGRPPTTVDWVKGGGNEHPCAAHVEAIFGSWRGAIGAAIEAAGRTTTADADIERQREAERKLPMTVDLLDTRVSAVLDASAATVAGEAGGQESLRQSLIDLASCAGAMADHLPPPTQWRDGDERHAERLAYRQRWREKQRANGLAA